MNDEYETCRDDVLLQALAKLSLNQGLDAAVLYHGTEKVPSRISHVSDWPGSPQLGQVCEYQLVILSHPKRKRRLLDQFDFGDSESSLVDSESSMSGSDYLEELEPDDED